MIAELYDLLQEFEFLLLYYLYISINLINLLCNVNCCSSHFEASELCWHAQIGQFDDDRHSSRLRTLVSHYTPAHVSNWWSVVISFSHCFCCSSWFNYSITHLVWDVMLVWSKGNTKRRGQSNLTKSASRGAHSPVRGHPRGSKVVPLNSWCRVSY